MSASTDEVRGQKTTLCRPYPLSKTAILKGCKSCVLFILLTISRIGVGTPDQDQVATIRIEPKEAYIESQES
jgi:hypothetical protein